ncbi:hydroxyacid dehydrogenase [Candidatus Poribacteria bacterium]
MGKPKVLLYESMHQKGLDYLSDHAEIVWASGYDEETLCREAAAVEGIIIRANGEATAKIMDSAPLLKIIGRHGVGVDNIDIPAATERGIYVVNTPGINNEAVAEHAVGLMMTLSKRILGGDHAIRNGNWDFRYGIYGQEMMGRTLGVIGLGNIGYRVAEICHLAFSMKILYHDEILKPEAEHSLSAEKVELAELLRSADYVSLHVPSLPETFHLIDGGRIGLMKESAFLINTSRGPVVDTAALLAALKDERIAGAGLDVYEEEPLPQDSELLKLTNTVLTPHMASHTEEAMMAMSMVAEDIVRVIQGEAPKHPVNTLG